MRSKAKIVTLSEGGRGQFDETTADRVGLGGRCRRACYEHRLRFRGCRRRRAGTLAAQVYRPGNIGFELMAFLDGTHDV